MPKFKKLLKCLKISFFNLFEFEPPCFFRPISPNFAAKFLLLIFCSLISYKLFGEWILFSIPFLTKMKIKLIKKIIDDEKDLNKSAALFFVLKKPSL